jgi:hypothetical protein
LKDVSAQQLAHKLTYHYLDFVDQQHDTWDRRRGTHAADLWTGEAAPRSQPDYQC